MPARTGTGRRHPRSPASSGSSPSKGSRSRRRGAGCSRMVPTGSPAAKKESALRRRSCASTGTSCRSSCWRAAVINLVVTGDVGTSVVLAGLTVFNAVIGLRQEAKAEESVKALAQMMKTIARVRRDGQAIEIDAEELVPGDVVLMEAGNRVPADGRICRRGDPGDRGGRAHRREPAGRQGDRSGGRRGRGARRPDLHGLHEHLGHPRPGRDDRHRHRHGHRDRPHRRPAGQHRGRQDAAAEAARRPVEDHRRRSPGSPWCSSSLLGLVRGESFDTLFITGVALAVAAIPTGLPGGGHRAAVDRHPRDRPPQRDRQAAARGGDPGIDLGDLLGQDRHADPEQDDRPGAGHPRPATGSRSPARATRPPARSSMSAASIDLDPYLLPMVLCADAVLDGESLIGDPTEGALIVLAAKGGLDIARDPPQLSRGSPRSRSTPTTSSWPPSTR